MRNVSLVIITRLKELRKDHDLLQQDVADVLNIRRVNYNRYESGVRSIPLEMIDALADYYQVTVDYLFGRED